MSDEPDRNRKRRTAGPTREGDSLADVVELLLDKGIVINADIAVTVGETELLGVHVRAAIASFETAAKYGLQFPDGTDARRVREAAGVDSIEGDVGDGAPISVGSPGRRGIGERPDDEGTDEEATESESDDDSPNPPDVNLARDLEKAVRRVDASDGETDSDSDGDTEESDGDAEESDTESDSDSDGGGGASDESDTSDGSEGGDER